MYVYTPYEPQANPTQGGPTPDIGRFFLDLSTHGLCGNSVRCPRVWKMTLSGGYGPIDYEGDYYLRRNPYRADSLTTNYRYVLCSWESGLIWGPDGCPIHGANTLAGDGSESVHGWTLSFEYIPEGGGYGWYLRTPYHDDGFTSVQSLYKAQLSINEWNSLGANVFDYHTVLAAFDYYYLPPTITIEPFYA